MLARSFRNWFRSALSGLLSPSGESAWPASGVARAGRVAGELYLRAPRPAAKEEVLPKANIRSDVNLVLIPVTVTDPMNRFVTGLEKEYFKVYEDKKQQRITAVFER
jgi:hypothetical protein